MEKNLSQHIPIMVPQVLEALAAESGGNFLDCTLGGAGHTRAILDANPTNTVTATDRDSAAIERAKPLLDIYPKRLCLKHASFMELANSADGQMFNGVLADLGVSTDQLRDERGFSFHDRNSLDMRMDSTSGVSAADMLGRISEKDLYVCLRRGGVGAEARQVAKAIVAARPFENAAQLAALIERALGARVAGKFHKKGMNPSTLIFQAIRMAVNDEVSQIEELLRILPSVAKAGSRFVALTFHSIEDRLVMQTMRTWESGGEFSAHWPGAYNAKRLGRVLYRKAVMPEEAEVSANPSARSARLRAFEFC